MWYKLSCKIEGHYNGGIDCPINRRYFQNSAHDWAARQCWERRKSITFAGLITHYQTLTEFVLHVRFYRHFKVFVLGVLAH